MWWLVLRAWAADPSAVEDVRATLSARDPVPCEALGPIDARTRDALVEVAETTSMPPWVPMRAAACVVGVAGTDPEALRAALAWTADPARPGFAVIVAQGLDALPLDVAVPLADAVVARAQVDEAVRTRVVPVLCRAARPEISGRTARLTGP